MEVLRQIVVRINDEYDNDKKRLFLYSAMSASVLTIVSMLVDGFFAFTGISNIFRSLLLVPLALSVFVLGYAVSIELHRRKTREFLDWTPYRFRFSPSWRRRISIIAGALLFIAVYASTQSQGIGYTFINACVGAAAIALFAFMRMTKAEQQREDLGIPDARDIAYDAEKRMAQQEQKKKIESKRAQKSKKQLERENRRNILKF